MIQKIKDKLKGDKELIIDILNELNIENPRPSNTKNEIRWGRNNGSKINTDTLNYADYSEDKQGDIITLVSDIKHISTGQSIKWLAKELKLSFTYKPVEVKLPFNGFWKKYKSNSYEDDNPPLTYDENILNQYILGSSQLWIEDGISAITQERFQIGYDIFTNRITIPYRDELGNLCGVIGRLNKKETEDWEAKYLSLVTVNKSKILYGLHENYKSIIEKGIIVIGEAEKASMQSIDMDFPYTVGCGKHDISPRQARLIKSTFVQKVVIAFDEGVTWEECAKQIEKVKIKNPFFSNEVGILFDKENEYLPLGSKMSPFDLGKDKFEEYFNTCIIWENDIK